MTFFWRYETPGGGQDGPGFDEQDLAEEWLTQNWRDLADRGVDQATLMDGETVVYGPMSLHAP